MIIKLFYYNCLIKIKVNNQINKYFNLKKQTKIIIPFFFFYSKADGNNISGTQIQ